EQDYFLPRRQLPDVGNPVVVRGDDPLAVWTEGGIAEHGLPVRELLRRWRSFLPIPEAGGSVASRGNDEPAVGTEGSAVYHPALDGRTARSGRWPPAAGTGRCCAVLRLPPAGGPPRREPRPRRAISTSPRQSRPCRPAPGARRASPRPHSAGTSARHVPAGPP